MKILFSNLENLENYRINSLTVGNFDGVHRGHLRIIEELENYHPNLLITFSPHPKVFLENKKDYVLTSEEEKIEILKNFKIDFLLFLKFDKALKEFDYIEFLKILKEKLSPSIWIAGPDHTFGSQAKGNTFSLWKFCAQNNIILILIPYEKAGKRKISSSLLRKILKEGKVEEYPEFTGRYYEIIGRVERGRGMGKKIGFPTLNIMVDEYKILPREGVYKGEVDVKGKRYLAGINVGGSPTFFDRKRVVEAHLFGFDENIHGEKVKVTFKRFLRDVKKFENVDALKKQIKEDIESIMRR